MNEETTSMQPGRRVKVFRWCDQWPKRRRSFAGIAVLIEFQWATMGTGNDKDCADGGEDLGMWLVEYEADQSTEAVWVSELDLLQEPAGEPLPGFGNIIPHI